MKLLRWIFQFVFGCHHSQLSRVFTIKERTYQVCVECGQEIEYSWKLMHSTQPSITDNAYVPLNSAIGAYASTKTVEPEQTVTCSATNATVATGRYSRLWPHSRRLFPGPLWAEAHVSCQPSQLQGAPLPIRRPSVLIR
jgi:hypothetical protein